MIFKRLTWMHEFWAVRIGGQASFKDLLVDLKGCVKYHKGIESDVI